MLSLWYDFSLSSIWTWWNWIMCEDVEYQQLYSKIKCTLIISSQWQPWSNVYDGMWWRTTTKNKERGSLFIGSPYELVNFLWQPPLHNILWAFCYGVYVYRIINFLHIIYLFSIFEIYIINIPYLYTNFSCTYDRNSICIYVIHYKRILKNQLL